MDDELGAWDDDDIRAFNDAELRAPGFSEEAADDLFEFETSERIYAENYEVPTTPLPPGVVDITGDRGVLLKYHKKGRKDDPTPSEEMPYVELHYEGFLKETGTRFDTTRDQQYSMTVRLDIPRTGKPSLIPGWEIALKRLRRGDSVELVLEPRYAYGAEGSADAGIPPDAALRFEIEVLDIRAKHKKVVAVDRTEEELSRLEKVRLERKKAAERREEEKAKVGTEKERKAERLTALKEKLAAKHGGGKKGKKGKKSKTKEKIK